MKESGLSFPVIDSHSCFLKQAKSPYYRLRERWVTTVTPSGTRLSYEGQRIFRGFLFQGRKNTPKDGFFVLSGIVRTSESPRVPRRSRRSLNLSLIRKETRATHSFTM